MAIINCQADMLVSNVAMSQ